MELTGYKEKLRRALLRARKLNLSSAVEDHLFKEYKPQTPPAQIRESDIETLQDSSLQRLLTNEELETYFNFAKHHQKADLMENILMIQAVRASVKSKDALDFVPRFHGSTSPDDKILAQCTSDLTLHEKKFVSSYLRIAPWIHYFAHKDSFDFRALKKTERMLEASLRRVHSVYKNMLVRFPSAFLSNQRLYNAKLMAETPWFFPSLPDNAFGKTLASFNQILAFNHFSQVMDVIRKPFSETQLSFREWIEKSDKETKMNWYQVQSCAPLFTNEEMSKLLTIFMCRFACLVCKDGSMSLWTLSQEGAPREALRDLESWILRDS